MSSFISIDYVFLSRCLASLLMVVFIAYFIKSWSRKDNSKKGQLPPLRGKSWRENAQTLTKVKGAAGVFFLKELSRLLELECKDCDGIHKDSGVVFRISMPQSSPFIICTDYKVARLILEGDNNKGINEADKSPVFRQFDLFPNRPNMVSNSTECSYRHTNRKFIASAFSMKNLSYTFHVVYNNLLIGSTIIDQKIKDNQPLQLGEFMLNLTFDTIIESSFGTKLNTQLNNVNNTGITSTTATKSSGTLNNNEIGALYMHHQDIFLRIIAANLMNPFKKYIFWSSDHKKVKESREFKYKMAEYLYENYKKQHSSDEVESDTSIMGHLYRNKYKDNIDRYSDMLVFISAGHETTSWTIVWLLLALAKHPEVKKKLQLELDACIPSRHGSSTESSTSSSSVNATTTASAPNNNTTTDTSSETPSFPTISTLSSLPYLSMCIKETMRLHPVAASGPRRVTSEDMYVTTNTHTTTTFIPKGSTIQVPLYSMFRSDWIIKSDEFIPERWDKENTDYNQQYKEIKEMFIPFSTGKRNCIGQNLANIELLIIASYMIRYYDFKLISEPEIELFLTFKAQNVLMQVSHRD